MEKPKANIDIVELKETKDVISDTDSKLEPALKVTSEELSENIFLNRPSVTSALGKVSQKFQEQVTDLIQQKSKDPENKFIEHPDRIYIGRVNHENIAYGPGMLILDNGDVYIGDFENDLSAANVELLNHEGERASFASYVPPGHAKVAAMLQLEPSIAEALATQPAFPARQYLKAEHLLMPILGPFEFNFYGTTFTYRGQFVDGQRTGYGVLIRDDGRYQEAIWENGDIAKDSWYREAYTGSKPARACWAARYCAAKRAAGTCACGDVELPFARLFGGEYAGDRPHGTGRLVFQGDGWRWATEGQWQSGGLVRGKHEWRGLLKLVGVKGEERRIAATAYAGEIRAGSLHGEGRLTDEHGVTRPGLFEDDELVQWLD